MHTVEILQKLQNFAIQPIQQCVCLNFDTLEFEFECNLNFKRMCLCRSNPHARMSGTKAEQLC